MKYAFTIYDIYPGRVLPPLPAEATLTSKPLKHDGGKWVIFEISDANHAGDRKSGKTHLFFYPRTSSGPVELAAGRFAHGYIQVLVDEKSYDFLPYDIDDFEALAYCVAETVVADD